MNCARGCFDRAIKLDCREKFADYAGRESLSI
jgi:hypothetical protein